MKTIKSILIIFTALATAGCARDKFEPISGSFFHKNFVQVYIEPTSLSLSRASWDGEYNYLFLSFKGEAIGSNAEKFTALSERYNDLSYNNYLTPFTNWAVSEPVSRISVICDRDVLGCQAGEPLDGIIKFCGASAYGFIQNGYEPNVQIESPFGYAVLYPRDYHPIFAPLDALGSNEMTLLYSKMGALYFPELPAAGEYGFTVTVEIGGKVITQSIDVTF